MNEPTPLRKGASAVQFAFELGQRVMIRGPNIEADIAARIDNERGQMYEIVFWTNQGQRVTTIVFARELRPKD
jgi:hypothetical protein